MPQSSRWQTRLLTSHSAFARHVNDLPLAHRSFHRSIVEIAPAHFFQHFLEQTEKLLDNHLDILAYEDSMREMYNIHAYKAFTIDKLILAAVRQVCVPVP